MSTIRCCTSSSVGSELEFLICFCWEGLGEFALAACGCCCCFGGCCCFFWGVCNDWECSFSSSWGWGSFSWLCYCFTCDGCSITDVCEGDFKVSCALLLSSLTEDNVLELSDFSCSVWLANVLTDAFDWVLGAASVSVGGSNILVFVWITWIQSFMLFCSFCEVNVYFNPSNTNPSKWSKILQQFVGNTQ